MNLSKFLSKFRFCLINSRDISTITKLIYQSKKFNRLYHRKAIKNSYAESIRYRFRFFKKNVDMYMRTETGDINMFYEIFWSGMYNIPESILAAPLNIMDLGANVGFTTLYFALKYPDAKIISLEPSKMNFVVLQKNIAPQKNVKAIMQALPQPDNILNVKQTFMRKKVSLFHSLHYIHLFIKPYSFAL